MDDHYLAAPDRYQRQPYRAAGRHGLRLPGIGLGLWHNFGEGSDPARVKAMVHQAFDLGITHFDLANNYGPPPGSAETTFGRVLKGSLAPYRDELIIASKAGYVMWDGPYGDGGSAKYLFASLHQSLRRLRLDYVDIFYHHRPDPRTPLEETCQALALMVRQGKALYIGLSNYPAPLAAKAAARLAELGTPCLVNQLKYSLFQRDVERIVNTIFEEIVSAMSRGDRVELRGFGAFSVKARDARVGRNPRTGESVDVDEKHVPFFKTGKLLRDRLNGDE